MKYIIPFLLVIASPTMAYALFSKDLTQMHPSCLILLGFFQVVFSFWCGMMSVKLYALLND